MKKLFAVLMAISLILSMGAIAFAADTWTGSITIEGTKTVPVTGKTFNAYKVLDAKAINANDLNDGVVYTIPAELKSFYDGLITNKAGTNATVDEVTAYINGLDAEGLQEFAVAALAAAKAASVAGKASEIKEGKAVISDLAFGYYVVEDTGATTPVSALMLRSKSETVKIKADKPSITKKIDGAIDGDSTTTALVDYNTATVGEDVPYVLTSMVPDMTGYTAYTYTVTDTFSAGLTFNNDVAITIGGETYEDFDVDVEDQVVTITFNNFIEQTAKDEIKITYSAKVNENAVVGVEGNPNTVYLTYSNNPQFSTSTENTPEDEVRTYLAKLIINKTGNDNVALPGALFEIRQNGVAIATGESDALGIVEFTWTNGVGLKDGETYTIVEKKAPDGYNEAEDITFTVSCIDPADDAANENCEWNSNNDKVTFKTENNRYETTIKNTTGTLLPSTGGIGTTIFYVVGIALMVGALVVLVARKRMTSFA